MKIVEFYNYFWSVNIFLYVLDKLHAFGGDLWILLTVFTAHYLIIHCNMFMKTTGCRVLFEFFHMFMLSKAGCAVWVMIEC